MWHNNLHQAARRRSHFTGEGLRRAVNALKHQGQDTAPIPTADPAQAHFEVELLLQIGRYGVTDDSGWRPGDDPFGIRWLTPYPDRLDMGIRLRHLPSVLRSILPIYSDDHPEPFGICGLRFRLHGNRVDLFRIGLPGLVRIRSLTAGQWWQGVNTMLAEMVRDEAPGLESALWYHYPDRMHPVEADFAHSYNAGYSTDPGSLTTRVAPVASDFLRHHLIFRNPGVGSIDLWMNRSLELEWFDGPTHQEIVTDLTDPVFGMAARLNHESCSDCASGRCRYSVRLTDCAGERISLRRNRSPEGCPERDERAHIALRRRLAMLQRFEGSTSIITSGVPRQEPPPVPERQQPRLEPVSEGARRQPDLASRAHNSVKVLKNSAGMPAVVQLAAAWNAFTVTAMISAALRDCASLGCRNFETAQVYARNACEKLHAVVGEQLIHRHGRTTDTTTTNEAEFDTAWDHFEIETMILDDDGIDRVASTVVSLAAALRDHLAAIADDTAALPPYRKLAHQLDRVIAEIWAHFGGDGAGWWA